MHRQSTGSGPVRDPYAADLFGGGCMKTEKSCGTILFTYRNGNRLYILIREPSGENCGFPKGHVEADESEIQTALRETWEETGIRARILPGFREEFEYILPNGNRKLAVYFAADCTDPRPQPGPGEQLEARLYPFAQACEALSYANMKRVLQMCDRWLNDRRVESSSL